MAGEGDNDEIYICYECFGEAFLKKGIFSEGPEQGCQFYAQTEKAWTLEELE